jgi:hypothetical protein
MDLEVLSSGFASCAREYIPGKLLVKINCPRREIFFGLILNSTGRIRLHVSADLCIQASAD